MKRHFIFPVLVVALLFRFAENIMPKAAYAKAYYHFGAENDSKNNYREAIQFYKKALYHDPSLVYLNYFI